MKTRLEQLDIERAYIMGSKIECSSIDNINYIDATNPSFAWNIYDYRIKEEPKRVPFDSSDAFNLLGKKFKDKNCEYDFFISIGSDEDGIYFHNNLITYGSLSDDYEIWNELLEIWQPCNKLA
jgi:hypothetical protein